MKKAGFLRPFFYLVIAARQRAALDA